MELASLEFVEKYKFHTFSTSFKADNRNFCLVFINIRGFVYRSLYDIRKLVLGYEKVLYVLGSSQILTQFLGGIIKKTHDSQNSLKIRL